MDLMVFIAIGVAAAVVVVSLVVLARFIRDYDGFDDERPRLLRWRSRSKEPRVGKPVRAERNDPAASTNGQSTTNPDRPAPSASERVAAYVPSTAAAQPSAATVAPKRSVSVNEPGRSNVEGAPQKANPGGGEYGRVGEQVTALLTTAERAALEIREAADRDAEEIRLTAENGVSDARAEAEALRTEADAYRDETRSAADSYAEETRRAADADAAKAHAAAEEKAEAIVAQAERKAKEMDAEALRRHDALSQTALDLEERIAGMLTAFRTMTSDLEGLLPTGAERADEPPESPDDVVDDTLEDALKPERTA